MAANNVAQLRFLATVRRQSAPPRCNPFAIVVQVLALGMVFIGVTMTLIAHWPGSTSIGENPLKIAGPVLLCVGVVVFFIGFVVVCMLNRRERRRWEKTLARIVASGPMVDPSSSAVGDEKIRTSAALEAKKPLSIYNEPATYQSHHGAEANSNTDRGGRIDDNQEVPDAVRVTKPRRPKKADVSGETSSSFEDLTTTMTTQHVVVEETVVRTKRVRPAPADVAASSVEESRGLLHDESGAMSGGASASGESKRLHVHVKAQPGATVRIHQAVPPPVAPKPAFSAHNRSAETDI
jgi:hypothetical protein